MHGGGGGGKHEHEHEHSNADSNGSKNSREKVQLDLLGNPTAIPDQTAAQAFMQQVQKQVEYLLVVAFC
jgi:hypothetical protein